MSYFCLLVSAILPCRRIERAQELVHDAFADTETQKERPSDTAQLGAAGEYYVMSQLLRRGFIAALAPRGVPDADIIVSNQAGDQLFSIQVKTRRDIGADGGWHMKKKHEDIRRDRLFYCFVDFGKSLSDPASVHIVPSAAVATVLAESHQQWLNSPGKRGHVRKDGVMRRFRPSYGNLFGASDTRYQRGWLDQYRDAWSLLSGTSPVISGARRS